MMALCLQPVWADKAVCAVPGVTVTAATQAETDRVCSVVSKAAEQFERCGPLLPNPVDIFIVDELDMPCLGVYHCETSTIEILSAPAITQLRSPESAFGFLAENAHFDSVVVHELAHSAMQFSPCPYDNCVVAKEYVAYAMQIMSLSETDQRRFEAKIVNFPKVHLDELNPMYLALAPGHFAQKVWAHLNSQKQPCDFIGQLVDGSVVLDNSPHF